MHPFTIPHAMVTFCIKFQLEIISIGHAGDGVGRRIFFKFFLKKTCPRVRSWKCRLLAIFHRKRGKCFTRVFSKQFVKLSRFFRGLFSFIRVVRREPKHKAPQAPVQVAGAPGPLGPGVFHFFCACVSLRQPARRREFFYTRTYRRIFYQQIFDARRRYTRANACLTARIRRILLRLTAICDSHRVGGSFFDA